MWSICNIVTEFAYREEYPFDGSWWAQPVWFNHLYIVARNEINRLYKKKLDKGKK